MDPRLAAARDELHNVQMDVRQVQVMQHNHEERLSRLEKRQADDAAMKSAWNNSPFPSVLGGTPQHGPLPLPANELFDDFDEHGQSLLGSLHLDADDEPARRGGATSRANSVRFDESALQGAGGNWAGGAQSSSRGEFVGPFRPGSAFGTGSGHSHVSNPMERSLSHKSSAGHSIHSLHSAAVSVSGRASSLGGLDTTFPGVVGMGVGRDDGSPVDIVEPAPFFLVLGSVPSIIRCWLTTTFAHNTMLYAVLCSGSQKSIVELSLLRELDLVGSVRKESDGVNRIRLQVYLSEAIPVLPVSQRSSSPVAPQVPSIMATFEVTGAVDDMEKPPGTASSASSATGKAIAATTIRIFIGSDTLRAHCADLLFSQNKMQLLGNEREKLFVPFITPENDGMFKNLATMNVYPPKVALQGSAAPFVPAGEQTKGVVSVEKNVGDAAEKIGGSGGPLSPTETAPKEKIAMPAKESDVGDHEKGANAGGIGLSNVKDKSDKHKETSTSNDGPVTDSGRRESGGATGIWGSWRASASAHNAGADGSGSNAAGGQTLRENGSSTNLSGYQPAGRGTSGRGMKVLKAPKPVGSGSVGGSGSVTGSNLASSNASIASLGSNSARPAAVYEPPSSRRSSGEIRRRSENGGAPLNVTSGATTSAYDNGVSTSTTKTPVGSGTPSARWDAGKRNSSGSLSGEAKTAAPTTTSTTTQHVSSTPLAKRSLNNNPLGGASAFSWIKDASDGKEADKNKTTGANSKPSPRTPAATTAGGFE